MSDDTYTAGVLITGALWDQLPLGTVVQDCDNEDWTKTSTGWAPGPLGAARYKVPSHIWGPYTLQLQLPVPLETLLAQLPVEEP